MAKKRVYPPDLRHKILELIRSGKNVSSAAREFEISRQTIMSGLRQDDLNTGRRTDGLTSEEQSELTRLRRENKRLHLEQEFLSKAAAWFARETHSVPAKDSNS